MTLNEQLQERLADRPIADAGRTTIVVEGAGKRVEIDTDRVETLGSRVHEIRASRGTPPGVPLAEQAEGLARRVTGLGGPLRVVEADAERDRAQVRSSQPEQVGGKVRYYELTRSSDGATTVNRYEATRDGGRREKVPFALTHEALGKLADEIAE